MVARVPRDLGVVASFEYLPRLAARDNVHSFHHLYQGHYTFSEKPFPVPLGIGAMLTALGNQWMPAAAARERRLIAENRLRPVDGVGDLLLFVRDARDTLDVLTFGDFTPGAPASVVYDSLLRFSGCEVPEPRVRPGSPLTLRTFWSRHGSGEVAYLTRFWFLDGEGRSVAYCTRYLGYGVSTVDQWPADRMVRETYRLMIPADLAPGAYRLVMNVARRTATDSRIAVPDDPKLARLGGLLQLAAVEVR
jgi:hypothetical protein